MKRSNLINLAQRKRDRIAEGKEFPSQAQFLAEHPDTRNLTLGEIRDRDVDNFHLLWKGKGFKAFQFDTLNEAVYFHGKAVAFAMKKLGCHTVGDHANRSKPMALTEKQIEEYSIKVDQEMALQKVRVERRESVVYPEPVDFYKRGFYIYHHDEIAFFVGSPMVAEKERNGIIIIGEHDYVVRTNAPITGKIKGPS